MSAVTVQEFDKFIAANYNKLLENAVSLTQHYDYSSDMVNDCYLKMRDKVVRQSGFTGNTFGYMWMSILNEWKMHCNRKKIRHFISIETNDNEHDQITEVEKVLLDEQEWHQREKEYVEWIQYVSMVLFNFVETRYNEVDAYLFKSYFKNGDTYKQLSIRTKLSQSTISNAIKPIKKNIKHNFGVFLKERMDKDYNKYFNN